MEAQKTGIFIAERRKALGLTQAQLAEKLCVTDKAISKWERGAGLPDINSLEPLAEALEVSLVELMQARHREETSISITDADEILTAALRLPRNKRVFQILGGGVLAGFCVIAALLLLLLISSFSTVIFSVSSIICGLIAWGFPIYQMTLARPGSCAAAGVGSLGFAMASVVIQFFSIAHEAASGDWSAIEDTVAALCGVVALFSALTLLLNILMAVHQRRRQHS